MSRSFCWFDCGVWLRLWYMWGWTPARRANALLVLMRIQGRKEANLNMTPTINWFMNYLFKEHFKRIVKRLVQHRVKYYAGSNSGLASQCILGLRELPPIGCIWKMLFVYWSYHLFSLFLLFRRTETASSSAWPTVPPACTPASSSSPSWASWHTTWTSPCRRWPTTAPAWPSWLTQKPSLCSPSPRCGRCSSSSCSSFSVLGLRWGEGNGESDDSHPRPRMYVTTVAWIVKTLVFLLQIEVGVVSRKWSRWLSRAKEFWNVYLKLTIDK